MTAAARAEVARLAADCGLPLVRVASGDVLLEARDAALARLVEGKLAGLHWMTAAWIERATDPGAFLEGAQSVIIAGLPYARPEPPTDVGEGRRRGRIAAYAAGRDYHRVFESRLRRFAGSLRREFGAGARPTVDYGPLLERPLADRAGMGWQGKSTMLLVPGFGPRVLLGAIATTLLVPADEPLRKTCGGCTRCISACPTGAISAEGHVLDARLCISYHTIENRGAVPRDLRAKFGDWVFGCDDCLDSCPVGARSTVTEPDFAPKSVDAAFPVLSDLLALDEAAFGERFRGRAIVRAKRDGLVRNACIALGNTGDERDLPPLIAAIDDRSAIVRGHAAWALGRMGQRLPSCRREILKALQGRLASEEDKFVREELSFALMQPADDR